ncbi:MAG: hypothetical protein ACHQ2Z_05775 [Elusimicrobiota bacterium]
MKRFFSVVAIAIVAFAIGIRWITKRSFSPPTQFITVGPYTEKERGTVATLEEILRSKNDNDPRLDHDFNDLSPNEKLLFVQKYNEIPEENRNERGTIVYLLGRNLRTHQDWEFLHFVVHEPPCLSLANCTQKASPGSDEEATGDEVTLAYPSLVALRQARRALEDARAHRVSAQDASASATEREALDLFSAAKNSKTRAVARMAALLEKKFGPR